MTTPTTEGVDLGYYTVEELRAVGIDAYGVFQPLLRGGGVPPAEEIKPALEALYARGLVHSNPAGDVLTTGPLAELLRFRAFARRLTVVRPGWYAPSGTDRILVLGDVAGDDRVLLIQESDGDVTAALAPASEIAVSLLEIALGGVDPTTPDRVPATEGGWLRPGEQGYEEGLLDLEPTLQLEGMTIGSDAFPRQVVLGLVVGGGHPYLVLGGREGEQVVRAVRAAGPSDVLDEVVTLFSGAVAAGVTP